VVAIDSGAESRAACRQTTTPHLADLIADVGEPCWLCGPTAAGLHQFEGFRLARPYHLLTTRERNVRRIGVIIHTTTSPARTRINVAAIAPRPTMTALDGALRDGLLAENFLHARINTLRGKGRYGIPTLLAVIEGVEITRGSHSWLEREVLRLLDLAAA
jgi:hypothetical protein